MRTSAAVIRPDWRRKSVASTCSACGSDTSGSAFFEHRANLDRAVVLVDRAALGDLGGGVERRRLDEERAGDEVLRLGERAVGDGLGGPTNGLAGQLEALAHRLRL